MTTVKRTKKASGAPKRSSSAFLFFLNDNRARIKAQNPEASFGEVAKIGSAEWKVVKPVVKSKYEKIAEQDKARYEREMSTYVPSPEDKKEKRKKKDPNAPKKASSAYLFYVNAKMAKARKDHPDYTMPQIISHIAPGWKALSEKEKKPYQDMAAKDKQRYLNELN